MEIIDDVKDHIVFTPRKIYDKYIGLYNSKEGENIGVTVDEKSLTLKQVSSTNNLDNILTEKVKLQEVKVLQNSIETEGVKVTNEDILQKMKDVAKDKQHPSFFVKYLH